MSRRLTFSLFPFACVTLLVAATKATFSSIYTSASAPFPGRLIHHIHVEHLAPNRHAGQAPTNNAQLYSSQLLWSSESHIKRAICSASCSPEAGRRIFGCLGTRVIKCIVRDLTKCPGCGADHNSPDFGSRPAGSYCKRVWRPGRQYFEVFLELECTLR